MKKLSWKSPKLDVRTITLSALLVAIQIVLNKISIGDPAIFKIGIGFLGTALIGYLTGPWLGGVILVLVDIISNTVFSSGGVYLPFRHSSVELLPGHCSITRRLPGNGSFYMNLFKS